MTNAEHLRRSAKAQMLGHEQGLSDGIDIDHAPDLLSLSFASAEGDSLGRPYWQNRGDVCRLLTLQVRHRHWDYQALYGSDQIVWLVRVRSQHRCLSLAISPTKPNRRGLGAPERTGRRALVKRHGSALRRRSATRSTTAGLGLSRISDAGKFLLPGVECGIVAHLRCGII